LNEYHTDDVMKNKALNLLKLTANSKFHGDSTLHSNNLSVNLTNFGITKGSILESGDAQRLLQKLRKDKILRKKKLEKLQLKIEKQIEEQNKNNQEIQMNLSKQSKEEKRK